MMLLLLFAFLAGIFTILSPCILPILPALLSGGVTGERKRPLGIVLGLIVSFTFFTLSLTAIVHATGLPANALRYAAIAMLILFGIIMIFPGLSAWFAKITSDIANWGQRLQKPRHEEGEKTRKESGFVSGVILGVALGLLWTPCAGPILAAITTLVATQSINFSAVLITLAYSIGAGIPMFLIIYGGNRVIRSSRFLSAHSEGLRQCFGGLMVLTAVAIALHWDMILQQKVAGLVPTALIEDNALVKSSLDKLQEGNAPASSNFVPDTISDFGKAPELTGIVNWINSPPLSLMQLEGKVVLIDFWTYSCINCLRTLPYLKRWYADYKDAGLVIIGVHTPEFAFEKDPKNVASAASRLGVDYPVAQDNDYKTWIAYRNHYWPAHYLIDKEGTLRMVHFGEGDYAGTENAIRELLGMPALNLQETSQVYRPLTQETYLGTARGKSYSAENEIQPGRIAQYAYSSPLKDGEVGLKGNWKVDAERIISAGNDSYLDLNFLGGEVYLVLSGSSRTPIQVVLDGHLAGEIKMDGNREYTVVSTTYGRHQISLKIPEGVSAYAFTFGDERKP